MRHYTMNAAVIHVIYEARDGVLNSREPNRFQCRPHAAAPAARRNPACRPFQTFIRESFGNGISAPLRALVLLLWWPSLPIFFLPHSFLDVNYTIPRSFSRRRRCRRFRHELLCLDHPLHTGLQHMRRRRSSGTRVDCSATWKGRGGQIQWSNYLGAAGPQRVHGSATHNVYCFPTARVLVYDRHDQTDERCDCTHAEHQAPEGRQS
jgi:hypothetical protein